MSSLRRMLQILDLYGPETPVLEAEVIAQSLGYAVATTYRYLKELCEAGLLIRRVNGYALGPRFILMDRQIRDYDPLLVACSTLFQDLAAQTGLDVLLSQIYGEQVLSLHQESVDASLPMLFGRGKTMDMFRSSSARIITAHLQTRHLKRLYEDHRHQDYVQSLGQDWAQFSQVMFRLRKQGYCLTKEQIHANKAGISAPVFDEKQHIFGSVTLVGRLKRFYLQDESELISLVRQTAHEVSQSLRNHALENQQQLANPGIESLY